MGTAGLAAAGPADAVVIVDVLSFSTAVDIAVARGASVLPYRWRDGSARVFAESTGALLAGSREVAGYSLSPSSLQSIPAGTVLVLPSPNGGALSLEAAGMAATHCACLRNAPAVAARLSASARRVNVIPAGEQWHDGSLRPAIEDLIGAGAVVAGLSGSRSPEAEFARAAFEEFRFRLHDTIRNCVSGLELVERGFPRDIELAVDYAVSGCVPLLRGDRFEQA